MWNWIYGSDGMQRMGFLAIQLDIVGFLAVLGEGSVLATSEVASLSKVSFLPRLMPAPQCLIKPFRPKTLREHKGWTNGVWSGNTKADINYVGHVVVDAEKYPTFSVRCVKIKKREPTGEFHHNESTRMKESTLRAKKFGPVTWVAIIGFTFSLVIFAIAIWKNDGAALVADIILSLLSSLVGVASKWSLTLLQRKKDDITIPPGDLVIKYQKGNFLLIECEEDIARELYFAQEELHYLVSNSWQYRIIALIGTVMLMLGVIFLANCKTELQIVFAGAYIVLNTLYWLVSALPVQAHWDTSCYKIEEQCIQLKPHPKNENPEARHPQPVGPKKTVIIDRNAQYASALWKAIVVTKDITWVKMSGSAPKTKAWEVWLDRAVEKANESAVSGEWIKHPTTNEDIFMWHLPEWEPVNAMKECIRMYPDSVINKKEKPPMPEKVMPKKLPEKTV